MTDSQNHPTVLSLAGASDVARSGGHIKSKLARLRGPHFLRLRKWCSRALNNPALTIREKSVPSGDPRPLLSTRAPTLDAGPCSRSVSLAAIPAAGTPPNDGEQYPWSSASRPHRWGITAPPARFRAFQGFGEGFRPLPGPMPTRGKNRPGAPYFGATGPLSRLPPPGGTKHPRQPQARA